MPIDDVRAARVAPRDGPVNERGEHANTDVAAQAKQALRLRKRETRPGHVVVLHFDSPQERRARSKVPAFAMRGVMPPPPRETAALTARTPSGPAVRCGSSGRLGPFFGVISGIA